MADMRDFSKEIVADFRKHTGRDPRAAATPGYPGKSLVKGDGKELMKTECRSLVGKLLYFVKKMSPECANAVRELSRFMDCPTEQHWSSLE
jgi:hypothetical protein